MSATHTSKTIPAPGLEAMLSALGTQDVGHPGKGWWSVKEIARAASLHVTSARKRCEKLFDNGIYEKCQRKIGRSDTTFYRLVKVPGKCSTRVHINPVQGSPLARILPGKQKRCGK